MTATPAPNREAQLEAVLQAALYVLGARQDQMLTIDEWTDLARAVAACQERKTTNYLTENDLEDIAERYALALLALAAGQIRRNEAPLTLRATDLAHEAYERLHRQQAVDWQNRNHFYAIAATVMRRVIVDHVRRRSAEKRGGDARARALPPATAPSPAQGPSGCLAASVEECRDPAPRHPPDARRHT